ERNARRSTAGHSTVQVDGQEQNRIVPGRAFALPDTSRARILPRESRDGFELAAGEHSGYPGLVHRRTAALRPDAAAFIDGLRGEGEHLYELRWFVPHTDLVQRPADAAERSRFEELGDRGLALGLDLERCVAVAGRA